MARNKLPLCDMHSHILPGMDDGSKDAAESIGLLKMSSEQGVGRMFATSHYYHRESVASFLTRREKAWRELSSAIGAMDTPNKFPQIALGAEVAYFQGISHEDGIEKLCLGSSNYMLLEMPFVKWSPGVLREVNDLSASHGLQIITAHLERYLKMQERSVIEELISSDVIVQMNAEYILGFMTRRKAKHMILSGQVQLLGSDCHNLSTRQPNLGYAAEKLADMGLVEQIAEMTELANSIFDEAVYNISN